MSGLGVALRVLRAEGLRAARDRALDRLEEWRERRALRLRPASGSCEPGGSVPILNLLSTPPARRLGGVQTQLAARLRAESGERPTALLYPDAGRYRLEVHGREAFAVEWPGAAISFPCLADQAFEAAVRAALRQVGARALHVESAAQLPAGSLLRLAQDAGLRLVLSAHDFALYCPRPDLLERPALAFCRYCADAARCRACLARDFGLPDDFQAEQRRAAHELLRRAAAVVHPSEFLRAKHLALFPGLDPATHHVIPPAAPATLPEARSAPSRPVRHIGYVGGVTPQKGALVLDEVLRRFDSAAHPGVRFSVLGKGDPALLDALRRHPRVSVHGYYRAGALPQLLRSLDVDLALLLSVTPESYSLALEECLAAGVPVVAFAHGAVADRVSQRRGGILVPPEKGGAGVVEALEAVLRGDLRPQAAAADPASLDPRRPARSHLDLYRSLGLL